jgi:hypothetical protein
LNAFGDGLRVLRAILTERCRIWPTLAIEASPPPIRKLPGKAAHVTHETTTMPALAAGREQRATEGPDDWKGLRCEGLVSNYNGPAEAERFPSLLKCRGLVARSVQVETADYGPKEQVVAASNTNIT